MTTIHPRPLDRQVRSHFALLPITARNGGDWETRWLCKVTIEYLYRHPCDVGRWMWEPQRFLALDTPDSYTVACDDP